MSRAFAKEYEDQWLGDVEPTMTALGNFLARENNGTRITEEKTYTLPNGRQAHAMSNGLSYALDGDNRWYVVVE